MKVRLNNVRIAFCQHLHEPGAITAGDAPRYSSTFLIPKEDAAQAEKVAEAIKTVASEKWGPKADAILKSLKADNKICLKDGEAKSQYEGFAGCFFISANSKATQKPTVIDADRSPLSATSGRPYAGCYVNAVVDVYAQDNQYGKRVNAGLGGVQFVADGDAFAGAAVSANDFDDISIGNNGGSGGGSVADYL